MILVIASICSSSNPPIDCRVRTSRSTPMSGSAKLRRSSSIAAKPRARQYVRMSSIGRPDFADISVRV